MNYVLPERARRNYLSVNANILLYMTTPEGSTAMFKCLRPVPICKCTVTLHICFTMLCTVYCRCQKLLHIIKFIEHSDIIKQEVVDTKL